MTYAQRFLSFSLMSAMVLVLAPVASASWFDVNLNDRKEVKGQIDQPNAEMKMRSRSGIKLNGKAIDAETQAKINIALEAKAALKACHEQNVNDDAAAKICAQAVAEKYGFTLPEHAPEIRKNNGVRAQVGEQIKVKITEKCGERQNTTEWRQCAKDARGDVQVEWKQSHPGIMKRLSSWMRHHFSKSVKVGAGVNAEVDDE